jgi:hypothetical protein
MINKKIFIGIVLLNLIFIYFSESYFYDFALIKNYFWLIYLTFNVYGILLLFNYKK